MSRIIIVFILVLGAQLPMYVGDLKLDPTLQNIFVFSTLSLIIFILGWAAQIFTKRFLKVTSGYALLITSVVLVCTFWVSIYFYNVQGPLSFGLHDEVWFTLKHCLGIVLVFFSYKMAAKYA